MKRTLTAALTTLALLFVVVFFFSLYRTFRSTTSTELASWLQVTLAALAIPVIYNELARIQRAITQRPLIMIGVANVNDLSLSHLRTLTSLSATTSVGQGYAVFWLTVRNAGKAAARNLKLHLEYTTPTKQKTNLFSPVIQIGDWLGDNRFTFKKVTNADFVFIAGQDWILHANDTEMFDFHMTTAVVKQTQPRELRELPGLGTYSFTCTAWADGLDAPITRELIVRIVPSIQPQEERVKPDLSNLG